MTAFETVEQVDFNQSDSASLARVLEEINAAHYAQRTGIPLSTEALYYGNDPANVPPYGGYPSNNVYNGAFYGGGRSLSGGAFNVQNLAYMTPLLMNGLTGGNLFGRGSHGSGLPFGYGGGFPFGGYGLPFGYGGYGGGIMPLAMGLGGLIGGGRGFGLGGLIGLGIMLGRRFFGGGFGGGGGFHNWNIPPRPQPRPLPPDGGDHVNRPDVGPSNDSADEAKMFELINKARAAQKKGTLDSNSGLQNAAAFMAQYMQGKSLFNSPAAHNISPAGLAAVGMDPDKAASVRTPADRIASIGQVKAGATGECMAEGTSVDAVFKMLMADPPHRQIMMSGAYNRIGVKRIGNKWVLDFANVQNIG